ncbi:MAG: 6-carboxytetrahydropterin synthase [Phycisphaerae bacterium]
MAVVWLMREIRFSIDRDWAGAARGAEGFERAHPISNSWGGWPSAVGVAPYLALRARVSGTPDAVTGYLVNIHEIDRLLRERALPAAARRLRASGARTTGEALLAEVWREAEGHVPSPARLEALELRTTPYLNYSIERGRTGMVRVTQMFEFSAAHRLHVSALSAEENRRVFGKCNNLHGHGHNYQVEVSVIGEPDGASGCVVSLPGFEETVKREVIDRLDHKHLNVDCPEFAGVNPSVENIAVVVWGLLEGRFGAARLESVRVWETAKTYAEYRGR